ALPQRGRPPQETGLRRPPTQAGFQRPPPGGLSESAEVTMSEKTRRLVLDLYAEVDREVAAAGPVCIASGRCCRFKEYGHVLYLSGVEAEVLLHSAPAYEQPVTPDFCPFQK